MRDRSGVVRLIAAFRLVKAAILIVIAVNAPRLLNPATQRRLAHLPYVTNHEPLNRAVSALFRLSPHRVAEIAIGLGAYALLFTVEGIGLWLGKVWAEYLTIVATASFIPFEIIELMKRTSAPRIAALVINIAIVVYLIVRRLRARRSL